MPVHDIKCNKCGDISTKFVDLNYSSSWLCDTCDSYDVSIYYGNFKSNIFTGLKTIKDLSNFNKEITTREIDLKCKKEGLVYGSHDEIQREAARNRARLKKESSKRDQDIADKIQKEFAKYNN